MEELLWRNHKRIGYNCITLYMFLICNVVLFIKLDHTCPYSIAIDET